MSKNCFIVFSKTETETDSESFKERIASIINDFGLGIFFDFNYSDPILSHYNEASIICSIADNQQFDNCEMLFLPDNCLFNGKSNTYSFYVRMQQIALLFSAFSVPCFELLIGTSGTAYEDYKIVQTAIELFPAAITKEIMKYELPPLHFYLLNTERSKDRGARTQGHT